MKKLLSTLTILTASFSLATAGDYSAKAPIAPAPVGCTAFDPGFEMSAYVAGSLPNGNGEDVIGGGIGFAYFFTENIGLDVNYAAFDTESTSHFVTADMVLRFPIKSVCLAPYLIGGAGIRTNGSSEAVWRLGGGVDFRPAMLGNIGLFADGTYNWINGSVYSDTTIVRVGMRLPF